MHACTPDRRVVGPRAEIPEEVQPCHHQHSQHGHAHEPAVEEAQGGQLEDIEADVTFELGVFDTEGLGLHVAQDGVPLPGSDRPENDGEEERCCDQGELVHAPDGCRFFIGGRIGGRAHEHAGCDEHVDAEVQEEDQRAARKQPRLGYQPALVDRAEAGAVEPEVVDVDRLQRARDDVCEQKAHGE